MHDHNGLNALSCGKKHRSLGRRDFLKQSLALTGAALSGCQSTPAQAGRVRNCPNIVLYIADALRADHLSCYGHPAPTSPFLDEISQSGMLFERCYAHAPWTKPSIASLFTGVVPMVHQAAISSWDMLHLLERDVQMLRPRFKTLAEMLRASGYVSGYFVSNPHVQKEFGFARGFDHYVYKGPETPTRLVEDATQWLAQQRGDAPCFLLIHEINPHAPYTPDDSDFRRLFGTGQVDTRRALPPEDQDLLRLLFQHFGLYGEHVRRPPLHTLTPAGTQYLQMLYDAEILGIDHEFRSLFKMVQILQRRDSVLVFTSDHGEGFGEGDCYLHGHSLGNEQLQVPLLVHYGENLGGQRVPATVGHTDLFATLVALAGGDAPPYVQGEPLLDRTGGVLASTDHAVFSNLDHYLPETSVWDTSMIVGGYKVFSVDKVASVKACHLPTDPTESNDLLAAGTPNGELAALLEQFHRGVEANRRLAESFGPPAWSNSSTQLEKEIGALGYL